MKVIIHGTYDGYTSLNSSVKFNDVRRDTSKTASTGEKAYSIQYYESNVVFSKYLIIRDVLGDKRTGNIAFSLVIPQSKKLSGENVIEILDRVCEEFSNKHISSDNLDSFREDWQFVEKITNDYKDLIDINREEQIFNSGSLESAYLYFNIKNSLKEYFELPYQDEYTVFKQVFLIDSKYIGKDENPVNALRHDSNSNLTDRIDLNKYTLKCNSKANYGDPDVKVSVNSLGKKKVSLDEILDIEISEKYKHSKKIQLAIKEDSNYIKIDHKAKIVSVEIDKIDLEDVLIDFEFEIQNENGEVLQENFDVYTLKKTEFNLTTSDNENWIKSENSKLSIKEKDLDRNHLFIYIKTNSASSFIREIKKEYSGQIIKLIVRSSFRLYIRKEHSNVPIDNCKIEYDNKTVNSDIISFDTPDEIRRIYNLNITHPDYDTLKLSNYYFTEKGDKIIYLLNNKSKQKEKPKSPKKPGGSIDIGEKEPKEPNVTNEWKKIIAVVFISCTLISGGIWFYKYQNRPIYPETEEAVNPPETPKDTLTIGENQPPIVDGDTLKNGGNQQTDIGVNNPPQGNSQQPIENDGKKEEENKKKKEEENKKKEEEDNKKKKEEEENKKKKEEENKKKSENKNSSSLETEFWQYVKMHDPKIGNFRNLLKKVPKDFKYYDYLQKISKQPGFDKFKKIDEIERKNATKITDIQF